MTNRLLDQRNTSKQAPRPLYDPTGIRKCPVCYSTTGWRRLEWPPEGGWVCCSPLAPRTYHDGMGHTCSPLCRMDGVA